VWYFQALGGIRLNTNYTFSGKDQSVGWKAIHIFPNLNNIENNLTSVAASIYTHRGLVASSWKIIPPYEQGCDFVPEHGIITFKCLAGTITKVDFASFGLPTGTCQSGFSINPACNAQDSVKIVSGLCLGKSQCTIPAEDSLFGDPCFGTFKALAVRVSGCDYIDFVQNATIPVNSIGKVAVNTLGYSGNAVNVMESDAVVWTQGRFIQGNGIKSAYYDPLLNVIEFTVGSGSYNFQLSYLALNNDNSIVCHVFDENERAVMKCPTPGTTITKINYVSYGSAAKGTCGNWMHGDCAVGSARTVVERACLGKVACDLFVHHSHFGDGVPKICPRARSLTVEFLCS